MLAYQLRLILALMTCIVGLLSAVYGLYLLVTFDNCSFVVPLIIATISVLIAGTLNDE